MSLKSIYNNLKNTPHIKITPKMGSDIKIRYRFSNGVTFKGNGLPSKGEFFEEKDGTISSFNISHDCFNSRSIDFFNNKLSCIGNKIIHIFEDASEHMEEIETFFYMAKLLCEESDA